MSSPFLDAITEQAEWIPSKFAAIWRDHPEYGNSLDGEGIRAEPHRDHFPVMLREKSHCLAVFDGMRRTCVAALDGRPDLLAWVGRIHGPGDEPGAKTPEKHPGLREKIKTAMKAASVPYGKT
jgi:hypothetical protein